VRVAVGKVLVIGDEMGFQKAFGVHPRSWQTQKYGFYLKGRDLKI